MIAKILKNILAAVILSLVLLTVGLAVKSFFDRLRRAVSPLTPNRFLKLGDARLKACGPWTANIYLLTVLRRPDIWPSEDLALAVAAQKLKRLKTRPTPKELERLSMVWRPWRAVAARLLWHYYIETVLKKIKIEQKPSQKRRTSENIN